jgi:hypothetical protein
MRGHRLAVGDIGEMQGRTRIGAEPTSGDDGGITGRQCDGGMVSRREWAEPASSIKCCRGRRSVDDGARKQHGDRTSHGEGSGGAHGMRGHRLAVGDVGEMQGRTRIGAEPTSADDGGHTLRKYD